MKLGFWHNIQQSHLNRTWLIYFSNPNMSNLALFFDVRCRKFASLGPSGLQALRASGEKSRGWLLARWGVAGSGPT